MPLKPIHNATPFLKLFGKLASSVLILKPLTFNLKRSKLHERAKPCIFLGYSESQKGYKILDIDTNKIVSLARNVIFHEKRFPYHLYMYKLQAPTSNYTHAIYLPSSSPLIHECLDFSSPSHIFHSHDNPISPSHPTSDPLLHLFHPLPLHT